MADAEENQPEEKSEESQKPEEIQFIQVASIFFNQGAMALGAMPNPMTGEFHVNFDSVRDSIAILEVFQEKTQGNLEENESKALASMIDELKLAFVQAVRDPQVRELAEKSKERATSTETKESSKILTPDGRPAASEDGPKIILPGSGV